MKHDLDQAVNMKLILSIFEQLSGLKINFHKSEIFCFGKAKDHEHEYKKNFGCEAGSLPFKYLGIPVHYRKLLKKEWKPCEDRFEKKTRELVRKIVILWGQVSPHKFCAHELTDVPVIVLRNTQRGA
jgi:hypothetical protein